MVTFGEAERNIQHYFVIDQIVQFNGKEYNIKKAGKPTCKNGEPKTDIYLCLQNGCDEIEIKISYKKENADFLENKIGSERAEQLFGMDWKNIIEKSTEQIKNKFLAKPLIYQSQYKKTEKGAITLGWKFELMNKPSGELSGKIFLNQAQYLDVYSGKTLSDDKRNATVNGEVILNSGVANYILLGDQFSSAKHILQMIEPIEDYITHCPKIYFACKALNYRTFKQKSDGNRPLAVQVDWNVINGKLTPALLFNQPLLWNGNAVKEKLLSCLADLNIKTTDDINETNAEIFCIHQ